MQRDYIMRLIEQAAAMLMSIFTKADAGMLAEAGQDLNQMCLRTAGLDLSTVKNSSPDDVMSLLEEGGALRYSRSVILAEILLADAALQERDPAAPVQWKNLVHAFCLLSDSVDVLGGDDEKIYRGKLRQLAARLEPYKQFPALKERFDRLDADRGVAAP
jgi:hypothetical protein